MNIANQLTIARLFLTLGFVVVLSVTMPLQFTVALALFVIASITDYIDGWVARRFNMMSNFGKLMDPLVDKIMIAAAFICLVPLSELPAWAVIIIISREFLITGLRLLAASRGEVLSAERLGKHKTAWQIITVLYFLGLHSLRELFGQKWDAQWTDGIGWVLLGTTLAFTVYSGIGYLWRHRSLLSD